jgi:hypothetical protein
MKPPITIQAVLLARQQVSKVVRRVNARMSFIGSSVYRCEKMGLYNGNRRLFLGIVRFSDQTAELPTLPSRANYQCFAPINCTF